MNTKRRILVNKKAGDTSSDIFKPNNFSPDIFTPNILPGESLIATFVFPQESTGIVHKPYHLITAGEYHKFLTRAGAIYWATRMFGDSKYDSDIGIWGIPTVLEVLYVRRHCMRFFSMVDEPIWTDYVSESAGVPMGRACDVNGCIQSRNAEQKATAIRVRRQYFDRPGV